MQSNADTNIFFLELTCCGDSMNRSSISGFLIVQVSCLISNRAISIPFRRALRNYNLGPAARGSPIGRHPPDICLLQETCNSPKMGQTTHRRHLLAVGLIIDSS